MNIKTKAGTAFQQAGEGPVVVLIHGLGLNMDVWQWQLDALLQHYTVLRYDLLGHGDSIKPKGAYTMVQMVDQLHQLMDDQGHQQCVVRPLYTSDAADDLLGVDPGGLPTIKKKHPTQFHVHVLICIPMNIV